MDESGADLRTVVDRARGGDTHALGELFDLFYDDVFRYARVRLGSVADAEEATGETFAQMVRSIHRFRWRGREFRAWLFRIARNVVADEVRRIIRRGEDLHASFPDEGPGSPSAEETAMTMETAADVRTMLATLPPDQRAVLELRIGAGLSADETGSVLGKSAGAVRIQQMRALQALRERMEAIR